MYQHWTNLLRKGLLPLALLCCFSLFVGSWGCSQPSTEPTLEDGGVLVIMSADADPALTRLTDSIKAYLKTLSGSEPQWVTLPKGSHDQVRKAAQEARAGLVLVVQAQDLAQDLSLKAQPTDDTSSYQMTTKDEGEWGNRLGSNGATFVYTTGATRLARQFAIYEFLRRLGARFFHPEEEFVPTNDPKLLRDRAKTPTILARTQDGKPSDVYTPDFSSRSYSFHGSHPLEHQESFSDVKHPIDEARNVNDWIVKNRGNRFRGAGRGTATGEDRDKRVKELDDLRKVMGFPTGTGLALHNQQQGASGLVDPNSSKPPKQQIEEHVEKLLQNSPSAEEFGIHFGPTEFTVTPDKQTVNWINWAGQKALSINPKLRIIINNHITGTQPADNFDDKGCPTGTNSNNKVDYYDLAFHTDKRFVVKVHTVMFYPLEGPAFVYNQKTFAHKLCLMQKASAEGRPLEYFPEGSWWLSFDNPIPVYLPLYVLARGIDIKLIKPLLKARGQGTVYGHRMFNSGHEWGYWQQDYAVGLWHWNADASIEQVVGEMMDPLCKPSEWKTGCNARTEAIKVFQELMQHQKEYFLDRKDWKGLAGGLYAYFAGEDPADEIAAVTGFEFRPVKVAFRTVSRWDSSQLKTFRDTDIKALQEMEAANKGWLDRLNALDANIPEAGKPWLAETIDGIEINWLRARQTLALYNAVMAYRDVQLANEEAKKKDPNAATKDPKKAAETFWKQASETLKQAETVIRRREKMYRYPAAQTHGGGDTPETAVPNGTTYPWRVHTKTHTLAYWVNRHNQVEQLLEGKDGDKNSLRLEPVFAAPGQTLQVTWPEIQGLKASVKVGEKELKTTDKQVDLGKDEGYWEVTGSLEIGGRQVQVSGGVARFTRGSKTPPKGLKLIEPSSPLAQNVLVSLFPSMLWGSFPKQGIVFATDLDKDGVASYADVRLTNFVEEPKDGTFQTKPISFRMPVPDPASGELALTLGVSNMVLSGKLNGEGRLESPVAMKGNLELKDLVDALIKLAGFDEKGAYQTLGSILNFNPDNPPATAPFHAELTIEAWKP